MKKNKAFTMIELLFGAALIASLISFSIVSVNDSKESQIYLELENTIEYSILESNKEFSRTFNYDIITSGDYVDVNGTGVSDSNFGNFPLKMASSDINITVSKDSCDNGELGIQIKASNPKINLFSYLYYNSCISNSIVKVF